MKETFQQRRQDYIRNLQAACKPKTEETAGENFDFSPEIDPQLWKEVDEKFRDLFGNNGAT